MKNALNASVRTCAVEFGAILTNYEEEAYRRILDRTVEAKSGETTHVCTQAWVVATGRMDAGDTLTAMKKQCRTKCREILRNRGTMSVAALRRADVMKGQGWTEEEDAVLRRCYPACLGSGLRQWPSCVSATSAVPAHARVTVLKRVCVQ